MIYCRVEGGVVTDRAMFETEMPEGWPDIDRWVRNDDAQIGWVVDGGDLVAPEFEPAEPLIPIPRMPHLEPDQFWFGLRVAGYEDDVRAWVAGLNDPESPDYDPVVWAAASAKLDFAKYFERDHPLVEAAREAIGMSEAELDALWQFAAG